MHPDKLPHPTPTTLLSLKGGSPCEEKNINQLQREIVKMAALKASLLLCMLAFLGTSSFIPAQAAQSDFFFLNLMWPGSYCNSAWWKQCCMPLTGQPALDFFVESLETYDSYTGNAVTNCTSKCTFKVNWVRNFIEDMYAYWSDISCPNNNNVDLWRSTYCKYSPCSNLNQSTYFQQAITLRKKYNILGYLSAKGIVPSKTATYDLEDIESALRANLGFSFVVECNRKLPRFDGDQLLRVKICVSGDGKNIITCPISKDSNCASTVKIPPFTSDMLIEDVELANSNPIKMPFEKNQAA